MFFSNVLPSRHRRAARRAGQSATPARRSQSARRLRHLAVECLEQRELLATGLTASLSKGVLAIAGTEQADTITVRQKANRLSIDGLSSTYAVSQVKQITVRALGGNDTVNLNSAAVSKQQAITIRAEIDGGAGNDKLIGGNGLTTYRVGVSEADSLPRYKPADTLVFDNPAKVKKFEVLSSGTVFTLQTDGVLYEGGQPGWANTWDFHLTAGGSLLWLGTTGILQKKTGSRWEDIAQNVIKFADQGGVFLTLDTNNVLYRDDAPWLSNTRDFALTQNNTIFWLSTGGLLQRFTGYSWIDLATNVTKFAAYNGHSYALTTGNVLYGDGAPWLRNTRDFALTENGTIFWLGTSGLLERYVGPGWVDLASNVAKFAAYNGHAYALTTNNVLYADGEAWLQNTRDFALGPNGRLYWLGTNGMLEQYAGNRWIDIADNVSAKKLATDGASCFWLNPSGVLYRDNEPWDANTRDFTIDSYGTLFWLGQNDYLERYIHSTSTWYHMDDVTKSISLVDQGTLAASHYADFQITLNMTGLTQRVQDAARQAAARWERVIVGDLPSIAGIDDIQVDISTTTIDGRGSGGFNTLARGGPRKMRDGTNLPYTGIVELDSADVGTMNLLQVLTHEMGHVLGFGTIWDKLHLRTDGSDPQFTGSRATAEYNAMFGASSNGVPVEASGGPGTALSHWRESVFDTELMTGTMDPGVCPLSRVTVASMADLGYRVNTAAAEAYSPPKLASAVAVPPRTTSAATSYALPLATDPASALSLADAAILALGNSPIKADNILSPVSTKPTAELSVSRPTAWYRPTPAAPVQAASTKPATKLAGNRGPANRAVDHALVALAHGDRDGEFAMPSPARRPL